MITLDTSAIVALINKREPHHRVVRQTMLEDPGPYVIPTLIFAEVGYPLEARYGLRVINALLTDLVSGAYALDGGFEALPRIQQLVNRYHDLPLGVADAAVIACAERNGGRVLTLDRRHFGVVAREGTIVVLPSALAE